MLRCDLYHRTQQLLSECDGAAADGAEEIDPKLKEAILKSRKLDRILQRKFDREKHVKKERLQQNQRCVTWCFSHLSSFKQLRQVAFLYAANRRLKIAYL